MGLLRTSVKLRLCMPGRHMFWSTHDVHNRICRRCAVDNVLECA